MIAHFSRVAVAVLASAAIHIAVLGLWREDRATARPTDLSLVVIDSGVAVFGAPIKQAAAPPEADIVWPADVGAQATALAVDQVRLASANVDDVLAMGIVRNEAPEGAARGADDLRVVITDQADSKGAEPLLAIGVEAQNSADLVVVDLTEPARAGIAAADVAAMPVLVSRPLPLEPGEATTADILVGAFAYSFPTTPSVEMPRSTDGFGLASVPAPILRPTGTVNASLAVPAIGIAREQDMAATAPATAAGVPELPRPGPAAVLPPSAVGESRGALALSSVAVLSLHPAGDIARLSTVGAEGIPRGLSAAPMLASPAAGVIQLPPPALAGARPPSAIVEEAYAFPLPRLGAEPLAPAGVAQPSSTVLAEDIARRHGAAPIHPASAAGVVELPAPALAGVVLPLSVEAGGTGVGGARIAITPLPGANGDQVPWIVPKPAVGNLPMPVVDASALSATGSITILVGARGAGVVEAKSLPAGLLQATPAGSLALTGASAPVAEPLSPAFVAMEAERNRKRSPNDDLRRTLAVVPLVEVGGDGNGPRLEIIDLLMPIEFEPLLADGATLREIRVVRPATIEAVSP